LKAATDGQNKTMNKKPFNLTADLDFLYISEQHKRVFNEALSAIKRRDGLICIIGESGTGKTTLCRRLLEEVNGDYNTVLVNTPPATPRDMTETLDAAFGEIEGDSRVPLAVFDEAQHLDFRCLDQVKFLTNLERNAEKLLQIVLVGQPELAEKISHKRFNQLDQRIGAKLVMGPLGKKEVLPYLAHRLSIAGLAEKIHFTPSSARYLRRKTSGVPRLINRIANLTVEHAMRESRRRVGVAQVKKAFSEIKATRDDWTGHKKAYPIWWRLVPGILLLVLVGLFLYYQSRWQGFWPGAQIGQAQFRSSSSSPSQFAIKAGNFLVKDQARELRDQLGRQGFPSIVLEKELGDGWVLYQVRLTGRYNKDEAESLMDILRNMGINGIDAVELKS
jgi:general secretion pathway protein A